MEQHLFILLFFTGIVPLTLSVPRMYYLIQEGKQWSDAQAYCKTNYTDLAIIESNDNMIQLQNEAQREQFSSSAWIGLYNDVNSWRWSFGNEPLGSMTKWTGGDPNNADGTQECVVINSMGWRDKTCTDTLPFVCFDVLSGSNTGNYNYIYFSNPKSWYEAQSYCRQYHTDLANTRDATEYSAVNDLVTGDTWIGLFRDSWKWVDKTNFSTISWMPGKPDSVLENENCGYLTSGQAADALCSDVMPFFCYSVISGKKQVVRIKVRSSEDMNGAAVMAVTLQQIKQKLQDHGIAGDTTVKWREQPDGLVFHKEK